MIVDEVRVFSRACAGKRRQCASIRQKLIAVEVAFCGNSRSMLKVELFSIFKGDAA